MDGFGWSRPGASHVDLVVTELDGSGRHYLNRYDEETLRSLDKSYCDGNDRLDYSWIKVVPGPGPVQLQLF